MFGDRLEAGRILAKELKELLVWRQSPRGILLALPRGGVVVGFAVHEALDLPLDVLITQKLGAPENPEYAIGALAETGYRYLNPDVEELVDQAWGREYLEAETARQQQEIERRKRVYRRGKDLPDLANRTALLVDDGAATGSTILAAVRAVRPLEPDGIVVAIPVGSAQAVHALEREADSVVVVSVPPRFVAVGEHYRSFPQVNDAEVVGYLEAARPAVS